MNINEHKKILFSKSSLLSLKAELLKKQEEVQEKKRLPQHKVENFKPVKPTNDESNKKQKKTLKDNLDQSVDPEEVQAYKKAKSVLQKKAELYEHLSNPIGSSKLAGQYLVDFDSKKQQIEKVDLAEDEVNKTCTEDVGIDDDDSEWVDFTDCLGRTRRCLKTDLEFYKEKDKDLLRSISKEKPADHEYITETEISKKSEKPFLVQKTNDYLQTLREKWEEKERQLLAKDRDIHYQDLLFDEARMHGVGYFSFSTDEVERRQQMEELLARREETLRAQAAAEEQRRAKDDLIASRLRAARARQRLRQGLPPEDPEENQKDFNTCLLEFLNKQKQEAEERAKEEERKIKEQIEKERQKLREAYVREWDLGKEGVEDKVKRFKEMTQEEYVEQQRAKRIDEFAPPQSASSSKSNYSFNDKGQKLTSQESPSSVESPKTWTEVRPKVKTPPPPNISDYIENQQKGLYFSTSSKPSDKTHTSMKYKNFVKTQDPVPIENELSSDDDAEQFTNKPQKRKADNNSAEIPPPPTYDYYGPVSKHPKSKKPFESDMREAFDQGTKSLQSKSSNRRLPSHYDFSIE